MNLSLPSRRSRRTMVLLAALVALPLALSQSGSAAPPRRAIAHGANGKAAKAKYRPTPKMFSLHHGAGEPTLGITKKGQIFYTASDGCVTSCPETTQAVSTFAPGGRVVVMSPDYGKTWKNVSPGDPSSGASPHLFSLDPYLWVDQTADGDRIFDIDLTAACAILSFSDDAGQTWLTNPLACGQPVNDHQTLFGGPPVSSPTVGYDHVLYYCYNKVVNTSCSKSLDGGLTFVTTAQIQGPQCGGLNGHGVVDKKGTIYLPLASCNAPMVAISKDEGNTWKTVRVNEDLSAEGGGDPSIALDAKGNLYYLFIDGEDRQPFLTTSRNGGESWSKPIRIAPRGVDATNLATLDVGAPGKVAIAYYGTSDADDTELGWNGYIVSGVDVLTSHPTFYTATINNPKQPLKMGTCGPGRCGRVLDFIDVEIAPNGQPFGAYVDACLSACEASKKESADNEGVVGTLVGGPNLMR